MEEFIRLVISFFIDREYFKNKNMGNYKLLFIILGILIIFTGIYNYIN